MTVTEHELIKIINTLNSEQQNSQAILDPIVWMPFQWLYILHITVNLFKILFSGFHFYIFYYYKSC